MLSREIGEATYHWPKDLAEADHYLDELIKLHRVRRKEVTRTFSVFEGSLMVDFYKDLTRELFVRAPVVELTGSIGERRDSGNSFRFRIWQQVFLLYADFQPEVYEVQSCESTALPPAERRFY